jgi:TPR repeat protein
MAHHQPPQNIRIPPPNLDPLSRPLFTPQGATSSPGNYVPPALSPLDAFAMQGRLLQKRFEQQTAGNRLSRLPPTTIASEFGKPRPDFFRSVTSNSSNSLGTQSAPGGSMDEEGPFGNLLEVRSGSRPKSHYPQMMNSDHANSKLPRTNPYEAQLLEFVREAAQQKVQDTTNWTMQRSVSPEDIDATPLAEPVSNGWSPSPQSISSRSPDLSASAPAHFPTSHSLLVPSLTSSAQSPASTVRQQTPNLNELSHLSIASTSSSMSNEKRSPPPNQLDFIFPRSPSLKSIHSVASIPPRPSFNFSRPISTLSRPSIDFSRRPMETPYRQVSNPRGGQHPLDVVYRQDSIEAPLPPFSNDTPQTPTSLASEELNTQSESKTDSTAASFVYKKYTLAPPKEEPRRVSARVSVGLEEFISSQFNWDGPSTESTLDLQLSAPFILPQAPPSPVQTTSSPPGGWRRNKPSELLLDSASGSPRTSHDRTRRRLQKLRPGTSGTDGSSYRAAPPPGSPLTMDKVAQEHLDTGVEMYQTGNMEQAAYHWRLAATAGQGTAMLLYSLACRHGWGAKSNLEESQLWLQSAVTHPTMQPNEVEDIQTRRPSTAGRKDLKAQFAINVYELGMTYSNGWGVTKDPSLALRCFEIAGSWGDGDAHAEAARCYLEGIGCKKDVQKAAKLYRIAESKGVAVPGNSW